MSFAQSLGIPARAAVGSAQALLRGQTLSSMARGLGVVLGAGVLAASYQLAYDEGRQVIANLRNGAAQRRARNDAVVLTLIATDLPIQAQDAIRRSRDALRTAMALVTDEATPLEHRETLRKALTSLTQRDTIDA